MQPLCLFILLISFQAEAKTWKVPVLYWSMKIEGQVLMRKGLEEEAQKFNSTKSLNNGDKVELIPYVAGEGREGITKQVEQFHAALKKNPDAIIIQPTDNAALSDGLIQSNRLKIPVIAYDQYIVGGNLSSFIASDNYQGGVDAADYIDSLYPYKKQELRIVVFEYPQVSSTTERVDGFFDGLRAKKRKFKVLERYQAVDPDSGKKAVAKFLKDYPEKDSVDVIFTVNDGGGLAVVKELWNKKRTEIKHATFDGDPLSVNNIREGKITVIDSAQFCAELGRRAFREMVKVVKGGSAGVKIRVPTFPITAISIKEYPGWLGVPQVTGFKKINPRVPKKNPGDLIFRVGATPLCPYICEKSPGVWTGYLFDILGEIAKKQGIDLRLESIPNSRLVQSLVTHKVDYIIAPQYLVRYVSNVKIVGRELGVNFTGALLRQNSQLSLIDAVAMKKLKMVFSDFGYQGDRTALGGLLSRGSRLTGVDVADRMIKMMKDGRADIALGDYNVLRTFLNSEKEPGLKLVPTSLTGFSFFVLTGLPHDPHVDLLGDHLNEWFEASRANGHLSEILKKYNLTDWQMLDRN